MFYKFNKLLFYIFIGYPLYGISFLFKRDVNLWVISGSFGFRDNSKYFSIYLAEERKKYTMFLGCLVYFLLLFFNRLLAEYKEKVS